MLSKVVLKISNLSVGYQSPILSDINLSVNGGELISIIGRNGEGKSTLIKSICSFLPIIKGNIELDGKNLDEINQKELSKLISIVLTDKVQIPNTSVYDYVAFGRYPYTNWLGIEQNEDQESIQKAIDLCKIQHLSHKYYSELSDGEKQKVNIARAIAQDTPIIILDEPTAHLDVVNKVEVFKLLKQLTHQTNKTIILSSHQIDIAFQLSDVIWLVHEGKLTSGTPQQIKETKLIEKLFENTGITFDLKTNSFSIK